MAYFLPESTNVARTTRSQPAAVSADANAPWAVCEQLVSVEDETWVKCVPVTVSRWPGKIWPSVTVWCGAGLAELAVGLAAGLLLVPKPPAAVPGPASPPVPPPELAAKTTTAATITAATAATAASVPRRHHGEAAGPSSSSRPGPPWFRSPWFRSPWVGAPWSSGL